MKYGVKKKGVNLVIEELKHSSLQRGRKSKR